MTSFFDRTLPRENPEPRYGPDPLTPERLQEIRDYLADCGPNDRNDPEAFAVLNYIEDLIAAVEQLQSKAAAYDVLIAFGKDL